MNALYQDLTKTWCDALLKLQVTGFSEAALHGGLLCPACARIHGRCWEAVYPLLYLADSLKDHKYLDAACMLFEWSDTVSCPDGSWLNETDSLWKGTTVFGALALGQALHRHGALLDEQTYSRWRDRLSLAARYLLENMSFATGNINYPVVCSAALAIAGKVLSDNIYMDQARMLAHTSLGYFTQNKLLYGEGSPHDRVSKRGCRPVDLCYNVEESLPGLALYSIVTDDVEVENFVAESLMEHLEFMLPDGSWDNSWGTRNYKWTYWGGRTSDGCQAAYSLLGSRHLIFTAAAARNAALLQNCTCNGLLYAGPHNMSWGDSPCIQHTFCHAKALATTLDWEPISEGAPGSMPLPRESVVGVRWYPEIETWLVSKGPWRATVTAYDWDYMKESHAGGGAVSLLWHMNAGPVISASLTEYSLQEPGNMQIPRHSEHGCLTPRIEFEHQGTYYRSINDANVLVQYNEISDKIMFSVKGRLVDSNLKSPPFGEVAFGFQYSFSDDTIIIEAKVDTTSASIEPLYLIPVISERSEKVSTVGRSCLLIGKRGGQLMIQSDTEIGILNEGRRIYNLVPGLEAVPLSVCLSGGKKAMIAIQFVDASDQKTKTNQGGHFYGQHTEQAYAANEFQGKALQQL